MRKGYTLIEVLISITIVIILVSMICFSIISAKWKKEHPKEACEILKGYIYIDNKCIAKNSPELQCKNLGGTWIYAGWNSQCVK